MDFRPSRSASLSSIDHPTIPSAPISHRRPRRQFTSPHPLVPDAPVPSTSHVQPPPQSYPHRRGSTRDELRGRSRSPRPAATISVDEGSALNDHGRRVRTQHVPITRRSAGEEPSEPVIHLPPGSPPPPNPPLHHERSRRNRPHPPVIPSHPLHASDHQDRRRSIDLQEGSSRPYHIPPPHELRPSTQPTPSQLSSPSLPPPPPPVLFAARSAHEAETGHVRHDRRTPVADRRAPLDAQSDQPYSNPRHMPALSPSSPLRSPSPIPTLSTTRVDRRPPPSRHAPSTLEQEHHPFQRSPTRSPPEIVMPWRSRNRSRSPSPSLAPRAPYPVYAHRGRSRSRSPSLAVPMPVELGLPPPLRPQYPFYDQGSRNRTPPLPEVVMPDWNNRNFPQNSVREAAEATYPQARGPSPPHPVMPPPHVSQFQQPDLHHQPTHIQHLPIPVYTSSVPVIVFNFVTATVPTQVSLVVLLGIPSMYSSRLNRVFAEISDRESPSGGYTPRGSKEMLEAWSNFTDALIKEWETLNIISALLLSALISILQLDSAAANPLIRFSALISISCALFSLLFGTIYIIKFAEMKNKRVAEKVAQECVHNHRSSKAIIWDFAILLSMPGTWFAWSMLLFLLAMTTFTWRTPTTSPPVEADLLNLPHSILGLRIVYSFFLGMGTVYFFLMLWTFSGFGSERMRHEALEHEKRNHHWDNFVEEKHGNEHDHRGVLLHPELEDLIEKPKGNEPVRPSHPRRHHAQRRRKASIVVAS